jgi:hypothetical protein
MEIIYTKSFDVSLAFVFSLYDLDNEKIINRKNVEIVLFNITGRKNQNIIFSLINEILDIIFNDEFLDFAWFKDKVVFIDSSLFIIIIILYFYEKMPFTSQALDYFYGEDNTEVYHIEIAKPNEIIKHFTANYDDLMNFFKK